MTRKRPIYAQPVGFLSRRGPASPYQVPSSYPYSPVARPPYIPHQSFFPNQPFNPNLGTAVPPATYGVPPVTQPTQPGLGGMLQNLLSGKGSADIQSMMTNAQKMIGVVNQLGTAVRNMSPMLDMLKGLSDPDPLADIEEETNLPKRKRVKRTRKSRSKVRSKARNRARKRR